MRLNVNRLLLSMSMTSWIIIDWDIINSVSINPFAFVMVLLPSVLVFVSPTDYHGQLSYVAKDKSASAIAYYICMFCMASVCQYNSNLLWATWLVFAIIIYLTDFWIYNPSFVFLRFDIYYVNLHGVNRVFITAGLPVIENDLDMRFSYRIADNFYFLH